MLRGVQQGAVSFLESRAGRNLLGNEMGRGYVGIHSDPWQIRWRKNSSHLIKTVFAPLFGFQH